MEFETEALSREEFLELSDELSEMHALFHAFWELGKISFTKTIETAAVVFNQEGKVIEFLFNKEFWDKTTKYDKLFIICHECLHIAFNHGFRGRDSTQKQVSNIAMDVIVNHTLVNSFGFIRANITDWSNYCWLETVFPEMNALDTTLNTFEHYYNLLFDKLSAEAGGKNNNLGMPNGPQTVDDHSNLPGINPDTSFEEKNDIGDFLDRVGGLLSDSEKAEVSNEIKKVGAQDAGKGYTNTSWAAPKSKVSVKMAWKRAFKKFKDINMHTLANTDQWAVGSRRTTLLDKSLMLPSEMEDLDGQDNNKIKAWFFLDVSGSCEHLKPRFWKAAKSVPKEYFNLELHSFSTKIWKVDVKNEKIHGGGGTSFSCIERYIQSTCTATGSKYPNVVIVITDGFGDRFKPQYPERWTFFLADPSTKNYIPMGCNIFNLKDFE